ncbi:MAG: MATE family efflux transporter [Silicimonas sp.]|nr:MATE family efflux transporter [Silicimonas sp.]
MADTPLTHRRVLAIALPIVLANATIPILGAVDTGVVGQLGEAAPIGAVGIGAVIISLLYWFFGFLRMGTSGMVAQAHGAGDVAETGALLTRSVIFGVGAGLALIVFQWPLFAAAFALAPASAEVEGLAETYLAIRIWGAPAAIAIYALTGWLIALERTRAVLVLQVWMNGLNIALDLWFVLDLGWGIEGVAVATIIAEWTGCALGLWLCRSAFAGNQWKDWPRVFDRTRISRMVAVNRDIMLRSVILKIAFTSFLFLGARFGDVTLAANQVLMQFLQITAFSLDGFAFAAEALVGQAVGAHSVARLRRASILTSVWGTAGAILLGLLFWIIGPWLIDTMAKAPDVQTEARRYLLWVIAAPVIGIASWMLDGIFIGATRTREMRDAMAVAAVPYALALAVLLPSLANHGLWASLMILNAARGVTLAIRYPALERAVA